MCGRQARIEHVYSRKSKSLMRSIQLEGHRSTSLGNRGKPFNRQRSESRLRLLAGTFADNDRREKSPYILSVPMQISLCMRRGYQRLKGDMSVTITGIIFNVIMALVIGSVFYNLPDNTGALYSRCALLFFAILLAAVASAMEVRLVSSTYGAALNQLDLDPVRTTPNCGEAGEICLLSSFCRGNW